MKKSLGKKISDLVFHLVFNIPYFLFLWLVFEDSIKFSKFASVTLAALFYIDYSINELKHDQLEERIKKLEEISKL